MFLTLFWLTLSVVASIQPLRSQDSSPSQLQMCLQITPSAAAELCRQSIFAGTPGVMHIDLIEDSKTRGWLFIRVRPGQLRGTPLGRADGVTLYAPKDQLQLFSGLTLNYYGDLSGGGFLISTPIGAERSACGSGFRLRDFN